MKAVRLVKNLFTSMSVASVEDFCDIGLRIVHQPSRGCVPKVLQIGHRVFGTVSILGHGYRTVIDH